MTKYYLWYFPKKGQCHIRGMGLHHPAVVIYKEENESDEDFKNRAISEFEKIYCKDWFIQLPEDWRDFELLSTKYLP